jgi:hypothetical protein
MFRTLRTPYLLAAASAGLLAVLVLSSCDDDNDEDEIDFRTVYGVVDASGTAVAGEGFTVSHQGNGGYRVTFDVPFTTQPAVTITTLWDDIDGSAVAHVRQPAANQFDIRISDTDSSAPTLIDRAFHFVAVGPR